MGDGERSPAPIRWEMKLVGVYSRVSTDDQKTGLQAQERALREWLAYKKISPADVLEFRDDGISGMKRSRPGFDKMMDAVRAGRVSMVVAYSFSRFARSRRHLFDLLDELRDQNVAFVSLSEQIDTSGAIGEFLFTIFAGLAQFERDQTAERVRNGLKNARAKGIVLGRPKEREDAPIAERLARSMPVKDIARELGVTRQAVYRVRNALKR